MLATKQNLLGMTKRRFTTVDVADSEYRIRSLTENEKSEYEAAVMTDKAEFSVAKMKRQRIRLLLLCLVDDEGNRLLDDADARMLGQVDGMVTTALFDACRKHVGFESGDIEALAKNSASSPGDSSLDD